VDARSSDFGKRLDEEAGRPALIRQRLTQAKDQQSEVAAQLKLPSPADEGPTKAEARRWVLETGYEALSAEIQMLDQELLSQPARVDLLKARRDKAAASVLWVGKRVKILEELANQSRQAEAESAKKTAEATRREAEGKHPLIMQLAEQNAGLTEEVADRASELAELAMQTESADRLARQLDADFKSANESIAIGIYGLNEDLGYVMQQQRESLPDLRSFRRQARERDEKAGTAAARRLIHQRELTRLGDPANYVAGIISEARPEETPEMRERLLALATERKALLEKAVESDDVYLRKLGELESAQRRLLELIERFDAFLDVHLLWVRSASPSQLQELAALPADVWRMLSPEGWYGVARALLSQATRSPLFVLIAIALGLLLWSRKHLIGLIQDISSKLGKPTTDHFGFSVQTLAMTLLAAAPWPLLMAVSGWQLKLSVEATDFSDAAGGALLVLAAPLYYLLSFRLVCMPHGLAAAHLRWPNSTLHRLRRELRQLAGVAIPTTGVVFFAVYLDPLNAGWSVGRAAFIVLVASLAFAFYRLLHPDSGVLSSFLHRKERRLLLRLHRVFYPLLVAAPLALGVLAVLGYLYTVGMLLENLVATIWMLIALVVLAGLAKRWLQVTRRQLLYEAALERRRESQEAKRERDPGDVDEVARVMDREQPEVDLEALSETSRELINTAVVIAGLIGLWAIWSEILPALSIFHEVALWHQTALVDGEETIVPITLANLGLAVFFGTMTVMLAKRLPALLEIILLHRFGLSAGDRYTFTTLTTYAVVTVGILMVFTAVGAQWSQLQWLVAALGVGIGFGLQEIVANFISGLIVLFERPIRIGDFVTVGETDGVVTKIRIRATTIRNWDGKELLVPNKEFITGRTLNWSLSDQTSRIVLSVGIAYGSNVRRAMELLEEAALEHRDVLEDPPPSVLFQSFGDNSLVMLLRCFVGTAELRYATISALNEAVNEKFNAAGITVAFPQRDLHLDTIRPLQVELRSPGAPVAKGGVEEAGGD
jgi:potassium efflux system protein